jgi:hypothetical protein
MELITNRRFFQEDYDVSTFSQIDFSKIFVPSSINPNCDSQLDQIILRALSEKAEDQYLNLREMCTELEKYIFMKWSKFQPIDVTYFTHHLFIHSLKDKAS